jgi:hypothetical protein
VEEEEAVVVVVAAAEEELSPCRLDLTHEYHATQFGEIQRSPTNRNSKSFGTDLRLPRSVHLRDDTVVASAAAVAESTENCP